MPDAPARVAETHISYVFLLGDRAYKLKKPVRFDFLDLSTREAREEICRREIELNRRLAPDVYLGVLDVSNDRGDLVDHLVEMKRLPDDRRLSTLVADQSDVSSCLRQLAHDLAAFHGAAQTSDEITAAGSPDAVRRNWTENLDEMQRFVGPTLDADVFARVRHEALRYIDGRQPLFGSRMSGGHVRDGHGDLLADDIFCLDDGPRALDCIEYNDAFRWADVVADVAFLAMDLERLGAPELADHFLTWYRDFSGESYAQSLGDHYVAYRASIRSKIACIKHELGDDASRDGAQRLLDLCDRRLARARVRLVLVGGLPGTGKSTLAAGIAATTGWAVLRSDEVRKDLTGIGRDESAHSAFGEGIYSDDITQRTYDELLRRAKTLLENGVSVICDASWVSAAHREAAARLCETTASDLVQLSCVLPAEVAAERMRRRWDRHASDADEAIAAAMAQRMDRWPQALPISTERAPQEVVGDAIIACGYA